MPKTRINCPNCRQPLMADVDQLFDAGSDPSAKSRLISGGFNQVRCPSCGYQGNLSTPIVYHDPDKELLLTYVPPDLGKTRDEQERMIGVLINQVVNRLPQEKRKGYLLRPQSVLTLQGLIERILEGDGITREMLQAQQQRLSLLQRLLTVSEDARAEIVKTDEALIDADFFNMLSKLAQAAQVNGDQASANKIAELQKELLATTAFGQQLQQQANEVEAAIASLRAAGDGLTRETLLDLMIEAPTENRLSVLVSLTRPGLDYEFFRLLSERIDRARGDGRARLITLREHLLELTSEIDKMTEARVAETQKLLESILQAPNIEEATVQALPEVDDLFMQVLGRSIEEARNQGNLEKSSKLNKIDEVIKQASTPPEIMFIEQLLDAPDDQARRQLLETNPDMVTPELIDALTNIVAQMETSDDESLAQAMKSLYKLVLRYSMEMQMKQ
jgi:CpXC protein